MKRHLLACSMLLAPLLWCQNDFREAPDGAPAGLPKMECSQLRSLTEYGFTVATAQMVAPAGDVPEYCRVTGQILPQIGFELALPARWNLRFLMTGNGGYAGGIGPTFARAGLKRGFAVAADSLHMTAETAKRLIAAYYGAGPARSYFHGCSTGGRQALILAQRFPGDFHGIIAGAPVLSFTGTMISFACTGQALADGPIPYAKLALLAEKVYAGCDGKDGLKDGIIDDPRRCDFRPSRDLPRCAGGADNNTCFTEAQITALEKLYADITSQGQRIFPGWPVGIEAAPPKGRSGWDQWIVRDGGPTIGVTFAENFFRYMAGPKAEPEWKLAQFDVNKDPQRLEWIHTVLDATDTDMGAYQKRGGKLLMYHGWADQALNPLMAVEYYDKVKERMGSTTTDFFRLFMIPGMFHCGGGVGVGNTDMLPVLLDWVEQGKAPERLVISGKREGPVRTRPICLYPQVARYKGTGSPDEAVNFTCAAP
ncbi:MAG: tannase/feruloyl esterase family alpha/beta hydrolase [Acidobacteria bacterium]|nr:tannase/feruloyl esterase family alpha/beta hydrolase [Acidobacteriota bacterium]